MEELIIPHKDFLNQERTPSTFNTEDTNLDILILKTIYFDKHDIKEYSHKVLFSKENILFFDKDLNFSIKDGTKELKKIVQNNVSSFNKTLLNLEDELENMEDQLSARDFPINFMDIWFHSRDSFLMLERSISRFLRVLRLFCAEARFINEKQKSSFADLLETIEFFERNIASCQKRLEALHHYYTSIKNDKMNKNIYILSILSGIFLPLNLIVGFFGMNTKSLYFEHQNQGTQYVVMILVGTFISILILPMLMNIISKFIIVRFLGRLSFYKRIAPRKED